MKIIFYHGLDSSKRSSKYIALKKYCDEKGYELICDEVNHRDIEGTFVTHLARLNELIVQNDEIVLVGHSMGGFYARFFNRKFGLKALIINPCLDPEKILGESNLIADMKFQLTGFNNSPLICLLDLNDEVLDMYSAKAVLERESKVIEFKGDGHKFDKNLDKIGLYLEELINTYTI